MVEMTIAKPSLRRRAFRLTPKALAIVVIAALAAAFSHLHLEQRDRLLKLEGNVSLIADYVASQQMKIPARQGKKQ